MYKLITIFLLSNFYPILEPLGQEDDWQIERRKKQVYSNTLDSLFLKNQYEQIIEICNQTNSLYKSINAFNLIANYYFLGDSLKSWDLLNREIARIQSYDDADAYSLASLLETEITSYKKFLISSTVKEYVTSKIDSFYITEAASDKENGLELLHLLIDDQWVRNISSIYDKLMPERKYPLPSYIDSIQAIQAQLEHSNLVFHFFMKRNKVFSKGEVGRIYYQQKMLFFHERDMERRKFYHELVKQGIQRGALKIEDQMDFEIGTLYIQMGIDDFFKQREAIQEEFRKKYNKPDYRITLM